MVNLMLAKLWKLTGKTLGLLLTIGFWYVALIGTIALLELATSF